MVARIRGESRDCPVVCLPCPNGCAKGPRSRSGCWLLGVAVVLGITRFRAAAFHSQPDLEQFFLPAARAIRAGQSPYTVPGYFYSPFVAFLLVPVADASWVGLYWTALVDHGRSDRLRARRAGLDSTG